MGFQQYTEFQYTPDQVVDTPIGLIDQEETDHSIHPNHLYNHFKRILLPAQEDRVLNIPSTQMEEWLSNDDFTRYILAWLFFHINWTTARFIEICISIGKQS